MASNTELLFSVLLCVCVLSVTTALHCLKCDRVISPRHCHGRTTCDSHEVCYLEQFTGLDGETLYNVGCRSQELCGRQSRATQTGQNMCTKCCSGDLCNVEGCGALGYPKDRGPICFNCAQTRKPERCDQIDVCGKDDVCHIEEVEEFGDVFYTTKCLSQHVCNTKSGNIFGKRQINEERSTSTRCSACCSGDLCNTYCYGNSVTGYTVPLTKPYSIDYTTQPWIDQTTTNYATSPWKVYSTTNNAGYVAATGHYGNNFMISYLPNMNMDYVNKTIELLITSTYENFRIELSNRMGGFYRTGQSNNYTIRTTLPANVFQNYGPSNHNGNIYPTGLHIASQRPIFVAGIIEYNSISGEGFSALPFRNIGSRYVVATYPSGIRTVGVVATKDNTYVRAALQAGNNHTTTYRIKYAGETLLLNANSSIVSTGGIISADSPISVFTGNMASVIKSGNSNFEVEMNLPVEMYTQQYIVPKIYGTGGIVLRVIPSPEDHFATVYINAKDGFYQNTYKEFVNDLSLKNIGYFINAQRNVMVSIYTKYDASQNQTRSPFMTLLPGLNQYSNNYVITTPATLKYNSYATIIFKQSDDENGLRINGGNLLFHAVDRTPIERFREVYLSITVPLDMGVPSYSITHTDPTVKFGLLVYGYGKSSTSTYAYPGGFNFDH